MPAGALPAEDAPAPAGLEQDLAMGQELAGAEVGAEAGAPQGGVAPAPTAQPAAPAGAPPIPTI